MPSFVNANTHHIYVPAEPEEGNTSGLQRVLPGAEFEAHGRAADLALQMAGVHRAGSDEAKRFAEQWERRRELIAAPGPGAFPAVEPEAASERSGIHLTGADSGMPVAAEEEPGDVKDGTGEDPHPRAVAVGRGRVEREGEKPEPEEEALEDLTVAELRDLADERGVELATGARKAEIVETLEAAEAEAAEATGGGGGTTTTETLGGGAAR